MIYVREYPPIKQEKPFWKTFLKAFLITFGILLVAGIIYFIYSKLIHNKKEEEEESNELNDNEENDGLPNEILDEPFVITEKHRSRISLLQECMKAYGMEVFPILQEENNANTNTNISNDKILSISTLEMKINKGQSVELFKTGFELEEGEYACISYENNNKRYMKKIPDGIFEIPDDFSGEVEETPFTFILYFNYDPSINEYDSRRNLEKENDDNDKAIELYNNKKGNNKLLLRRLGFFSKVKNFFKKNVETIVEKVIEKTVSYACVSLAKLLFQEFYNKIVEGISQFACDELGEFAGNEITNLIFKPNSKPEENYKEIIYEESIENNFKTYSRNIFSIPYLNDKLEKIEDQNYIEIKGQDYHNYGLDIIPPEELLTRHNHKFNPLGNLILAELSSAYLKPVLLNNYYDPTIHFFKQYNFEWIYTNGYNEEKDFIDLNTFLVNDKYVLFNNLECNRTKKYFNGKSYLSHEFYIAIRKIGESVIRIYKNPEYIYLEKFSDFKAAFWIKNIEDISSCFHFNNIHTKIDFQFVFDSSMVNNYAYAYKKINMAEYNISKIDEFEDFITYNSVENITMPFYSTDEYCFIHRFISNNYRLKTINWNDFSINKAIYISQFISFSRLGGIDLDMKFLKGVEDVFSLFDNDDLTNNRISNFDTSQITSFFDLLDETMGNDIEFIKYWNTSNLISNDWFILNDDIISLDLSKWNKTNIKSMKHSFASCSSLKEVDLSGYVKVKTNCDFQGMFNWSKSIEAINVQGWDFSSVNFTEGIDCNDSSIFDKSVLSSVKIYIDGNTYNNHLDKVKKFFKINNNNQFTFYSWERRNSGIITIIK